MKDKPAKPERWFAVYRKIGDGPAFELVALFQREEDALAYHQNPDVYFNTSRFVRLRPAPIEVSEPQFTECFRLLDAIVNGPDDGIFNLIDEARKFLVLVHHSPTYENEPATPSLPGQPPYLPGV